MTASSDHCYNRKGCGSKYELIMGVNSVSCLVFSRDWQVSVLDKTGFHIYRQFHEKITEQNASGLK